MIHSITKAIAFKYLTDSKSDSATPLVSKIGTWIKATNSTRCTSRSFTSLSKYLHDILCNFPIIFAKYSNVMLCSPNDDDVINGCWASADTDDNYAALLVAALAAGVVVALLLFPRLLLAARIKRCICHATFASARVNERLASSLEVPYLKTFAFSLITWKTSALKSISAKFDARRLSKLRLLLLLLLLFSVLDSLIFEIELALLFAFVLLITESALLLLLLF